MDIWRRLHGAVTNNKAVAGILGNLVFDVRSFSRTFHRLQAFRWAVIHNTQKHDISVQ